MINFNAKKFDRVRDNDTELITVLKSYSDIIARFRQFTVGGDSTTELCKVLQTVHTVRTLLTRTRRRKKRKSISAI